MIIDADIFADIYFCSIRKRKLCEIQTFSVHLHPEFVAHFMNDGKETEQTNKRNERCLL